MIKFNAQVPKRMQWTNNVEAKIEDVKIHDENMNKKSDSNN